jgi:hypothetical protein
MTGYLAKTCESLPNKRLLFMLLQIIDFKWWPETALFSDAHFLPITGKGNITEPATEHYGISKRKLFIRYLDAFSSLSHESQIWTDDLPRIDAIMVPPLRRFPVIDRRSGANTHHDLPSVLWVFTRLRGVQDDDPERRRRNAWAVR